MMIRKKHRRSMLAVALAYMYLFASGTSCNTWAATTTNHFTDLLPNPTSIGTSITSGTMYYNGYDWQVTSLGASQIPGDALSRTPFTSYQLYQSTAIVNLTAESTMTVLTPALFVGTTTVPAAWLTAGRSIRITTRGVYSTLAGTVGTWRWKVKLTTTTVLDTGTVTPNGNQTTQTFVATALLTVSTAGATGTVFGAYDIQTSSGGINGNPSILYSTVTALGSAVDLTTQNTINPTFTWSTASTSNNLTINQLIIELLN